MKLKRKYIGALLVILMTGCTISYAQDLVWSHNYGGYYNENACSGLETNDGGYLILGSTFFIDSGKYDVYLVKTNSLGEYEWSNTFGGPETEYGYDIIAANDNGYLIVGSCQSFGAGKRDVYLIKIDMLGNKLWSKTFGGAEDDEGRSVRSTSDGGYIICGTTSSSGAGYSDVYFIKTDANGNLLWSKTYGGSGGESGYAVRETADSGFIAIGNTGTFGTGYSSIYVVRIDSNGDSLWAGAYGGDGSDFGYSIETTFDKGFMLVGATSSIGAGYTDAYIIKIDSLGNLAWEKTFGGTGEDRALSLCRGADGNYLLTGTSNSFSGSNIDIYIVKFAPSGALIWQDTYGGSKADYGKMVFQESNFDFIIIGESYSYALGGQDAYILKVAEASTAVGDDEYAFRPESFNLEQNYPNPFNMQTTIQYSLPRHAPVNLTIFNLLGQVVREWNIDLQRAGTHSVQWDGKNDDGQIVTSGVYFYRLISDDFAVSQKMVLIK
ncbi:MAG: FlgD immunoglobulin-like domain containing protein [Candidatus Zixiibacteriota bacterium]